MSNPNVHNIMAQLSPEDLRGLVAALLADSSDEEDNNQLLDVAECGQGAQIASHAQAVAMMDMARQYVHNEPLVAAASSGNLLQLHSLVANGSDINVQDGLRDTALYAASCHHQTEAVRSLLQLGANPDLLCSENRSALHAMSRSGNEQIARLLLSYKASPNIQDRIGWTPLHIASLYGNRHIVVALLANGADPNLQAEDLRTPLHTAVDFGHDDVIRVLVEHGAILDIQDDKGETPLHISVMERPFPSPARMLLQLGANVNIRNNSGSTPLHVAVGSDLDIELGMIPLLLYGSDVDVVANNGYTPLLYGISRFREAEVEHYLRRLVTASANINLVTVTPQGQTTPLVRAIEERNIMAVRILLRHGADVQVAVERGTIKLSPIYHAAVCSNPEVPDILRLLLDAGSKYNESIKGRITPAHVCSLKDHYTCLELLLKCGADPNARDKLKSTPLHVAVRGGHISCVKVLLEYGADVDARDRSGSTSLHHAVKCEDEELIRILLDNGADVTARDKTLKSPLEGLQMKLRKHMGIGESDEEEETEGGLVTDGKAKKAKLMELTAMLMEALAEQDPLTQALIKPEEPIGWYQRRLCDRLVATDETREQLKPKLRSLKALYGPRQMEGS